MAYSQQVVMMPDIDGNGRPSDASDQPTPDKPQPQAMSLYEAFKRESVPYLALPTAAGAVKPPIVPRDPEEASKAFKKHYEDALLGNNKIGRSSNLIMLAQEHWGCGDPKTEVLVRVNYSALDEGKSGEGMAWPRDLERELESLGWPAHLSSRSGGRNPLPPDASVSALGRMWARRYVDESDVESGISLDEDLMVPNDMWSHYCAGPNPCTDWAKKRGEFGSEVMRLGWAYNEERKKTEGDKWKREYNGIVAKYREVLLRDYDERTRELAWNAPLGAPQKLLCDAMMVYKAAYDKGSEWLADEQRKGRVIRSDGSIRGLAFAWDVAGPYLCYLKAQARNSGSGLPVMCVDRGRVCDAVGVGARKRVIEAEEEVEADEPSVQELDCCV